MIGFEVNVTATSSTLRALRLMTLIPATLFLLVGCRLENDASQQSADATSSTKETSPMSDSLNKSVLEEANANGKWFHARKTRPIWAKRLNSAQTVTTLEGEEQVEAGHYLCRGEAGDIWPQTEKDLTRRYKATDDVDADNWRKYQPNPDAEGVMATQINHPFSVEASWGTLSGKAGDYLLKNFHDRDTAFPDDVWIVDQTLFQQTYAIMRPEDAASETGD